MHQLASLTPNGLRCAAAEQRRRETIGRNIARAREGAGLSQLQLAEQLGVDRGVVSKWERGRREPRADVLEAISALFEHGDDLGWLYQKVQGE